MIGQELHVALAWWFEVLQLEISEVHLWTPPPSAPVHLYVDARSTPPRCSAVLFADGLCHFTDGEPSERLMAQFKERADGQITSLEMLAMAVGLSTFADLLHGRKVVLFSDNRGAEVCCVFAVIIVATPMSPPHVVGSDPKRHSKIE